MHESTVYSVSSKTPTLTTGVQASSLCWMAFALILLTGLLIRLYFIVDADGALLVGCDQPFVDQTRPLVESKQFLTFEAFYYPPLPSLVTAALAVPLSWLYPQFDLSVFCRCILIGVSVATIAVTFAIGLLWGLWVAIVAAVTFSFSMLTVVNTGNVQVFSTLFVTVALYCLLTSLDRASRRRLFLMGASIGCGVASKYFPVMVLPMVFVPHLWDWVFHSEQGRYCASEDLEGGSLPQSSWMSVAWTAMVGSVAVVGLLTAVTWMVRNEWFLEAAQAVYALSPHEHDFAYHQEPIHKLMRLAVFGVAAVGIVAAAVLWGQRRSGLTPLGWLWFVYRCHWRWLVPLGGFLVAVTTMLAIPAALNLNNYLRYTTWMAQAYGSADGGMFPHGHPAPPYLLSFIPESIGIPLFFLALAGMSISIWTRDVRALVVGLVMVPMYIMLEMSSVKVNRYALELMPVLCLFAALAVEWGRKRCRSSAQTAVLGLLTTSVVIFTVLYTLSWASFYRPLVDVRAATVEWLTMHVPVGATVGMKAHLWLDGSPQLIPDPIRLTEYQIQSYVDRPEWVVVPKLVTAVVDQYRQLTARGYQYQASDWSPQEPPPQEELTFLLEVLSQQHYVLAHEVEKTQTLWGLSFAPQRFGEHTWMREHGNAYGIQIYRRRDVAGL